MVSFSVFMKLDGEFAFASDCLESGIVAKTTYYVLHWILTDNKETKGAGMHV